MSVLGDFNQELKQQIDAMATELEDKIETELALRMRIIDHQIAGLKDRLDVLLTECRNISHRQNLDAEAIQATYDLVDRMTEGP